MWLRSGTTEHWSAGTSLIRIAAKKSPTNQAVAAEGGHADADVFFWWLGQAGFLFRFQDMCFVVDPYLSDCLARKYAQSRFKHVRLMSPPIQAHALTPLHWILCTHRHSDHMDPEALPVLLQVNPQCRFVAPAAEQCHIEALGITGHRAVLVQAGDVLTLGPNMSVEVIASAHEDLQANAGGQDHYLGFVIRVGDITLYHSGDCVPYDGLEEKLTHAGVDVAFLPVNGRDELRRQHNIPGNFHFSEALDLCRSVGIAQMVCHHFGMFSFNTVERDVLQGLVEKASGLVTATIPQVDLRYIVSKCRNRPDT